MTIKFVCGCGKHLRAADEMASRRVFCPSCRNLVGVPALTAHHDGALPPMTPMERERLARQRETEENDSYALQPDPTPIPDLSRLDQAFGTGSPEPPRRKPRRKRVPRQLEKNWRECLLYPLYTWRICLMFAGFLTLASGWGLVFLPSLMHEPPADPRAQVTFYLTCLLLAIVFIGFPCSFFDFALSAANGGWHDQRWSRNPLLAVFFSGLKWILCFLSGPVLFAGLGLLYWVQCGELSWVDVLILLQLGVVTFAYYFFALLSFTEQGRFRALYPVQLIDLAHRMGRDTLLLILGAAGLLLGHVWLLATIAPLVHTSPFAGLFLMSAGWTSAVFWGAFFCRLLGVKCYLSRRIQPKPSLDLTLPPS